MSNFLMLVRLNNRTAGPARIEDLMYRWIKLTLGLLFVLAGGLSSAQTADWPTRPIKIIVGFGAGSPPDVFARMYGEYAARKLGVAVVIDNKPGAAGNLATDAVAKSPPDGYTFLYTLSAAFTINPYIYAKLPFDADKDLIAVGTTSRQGLVLIANPKFAARSIKDLVAMAKAKPGTFSHASYGAGSPSHLVMEWFKDEAGISMLHVPYRGSPFSELLGGQIDTLMEPIATAYPMISGGKVQALAYSGPTRHPALPDVPTMSEIVPGLAMMPWHGMWAPAATPVAVVNRLNALLIEASKDPEMQKRVRDLNSEPLGLSRSDMAALLRRDTDIYSRLVKAKNIRVD